MTVLLRLLGLLLVACPAAAQQPLLLVQDDLADLRPGDVSGLDWTTVSQADIQVEFCTAALSAPARLLLASRPLTRRERDACPATDAGTLVETMIGRRAVIAMTTGKRFDLTSDILYRALAREVPGPTGRLVPNQADRWRELDASLPDAPIRVLLPPTGSIEDRVLADVILYEGCSTTAASALSANAMKRLAHCITLRTDAAVARAGSEATATAWLRARGNGAMALVGISVLLAEPELETALPLDGVAPSFPNIADGRYRAVLAVYLLTVVSTTSARTIAAAAGPLLAETSIGPLGKLPRRGLAPLGAAERVKLRAGLGQMIEKATN
jgi:phosphate transport system substrate-binding protein